MLSDDAWQEVDGMLLIVEHGCSRSYLFHLPCFSPCSYVLSLIAASSEDEALTANNLTGESKANAVCGADSVSAL